MADVNPTPKIRCDNCGGVEDKILSFDKWAKPHKWGSLTMHSGLHSRYPDHIEMPDLCPRCASRLYETIGNVLKDLRGQL